MTTKKKFYYDNGFYFLECDELIEKILNEDYINIVTKYNKNYVYTLLRNFIVPKLKENDIKTTDIRLCSFGSHYEDGRISETQVVLCRIETNKNKKFEQVLETIF